MCAARNDERQRSNENGNSIESMYVLSEKSENEKYTESRKGGESKIPHTRDVMRPELSAV